jgi:hypothetical protein
LTAEGVDCLTDRNERIGERLKMLILKLVD